MRYTDEDVESAVMQVLSDGEEHTTEEVVAALPPGSQATWNRVRTRLIQSGRVTAFVRGGLERPVGIWKANEKVNE